MTKVGDDIATEHEHTIGGVDLVVLTIGLANAWHLSARELLTSRGEDPTEANRIAVHRAAVVEAVTRITRHT
jgi:hypothetical protein